MKPETRGRKPTEGPSEQLYCRIAPDLIAKLREEKAQGRGSIREIVEAALRAWFASAGRKGGVQ